MAQKVTTATCTAALAKAWTEIFGSDLADQANKWKRVSKRGKKGQPIERLFFHQSLPLQALVVEEGGAITKTTIRGYAPFEFDEECESPSEAEAEMSERAASNEAFEFLSKYPCYKASDFMFRMCTQKEAERDGETWYQLFPTRDFGRKDAANDGQLDYLIAKHLPEGHGEATEGTFTSEDSVKETRAQMLAAGFIEDRPGTKYVFFVMADGDFGIVAREEWEKHHSLAEHEPQELHDILPEGFKIQAESIWAYEGGKDEGKAALVELGFEEVEDPMK